MISPTQTERPIHRRLGPFFIGRPGRSGSGADDVLVRKAPPQYGEGAVLPAVVDALESTVDTARDAVVVAVRDLGSDDSDKVLDLAAHHPSAKVRRAVISALGNVDVKDRSVTDPLTEALGDPDPEVRRRAAASLARARSPKATLALRDHARSDDDAEVRRRSVVALGINPQPGLLGDYLGALGDRDATVRAEAAGILGRSGLMPAVPSLRAALRDRMAEVRREAAIALGRLRASSASAGLMAALQDSDEAVRTAAASALGEMLPVRSR